MTASRCCSKCRTPFSVCALKRDCQCHEDADRRAEMSDWLADAIKANRESEAASRQIEGHAPWR